MYDNSTGAGFGAAIVVMVVWIVIALGLLVWYLWAMARLFPRIGMKSTDGWIPVWNQWKLLERAGLPGWVVLLSFVGLGIVPTVMLIVAMHRIGNEYRAGVGYTVLGVFIPPLWATLFANFVGTSAPAPTAAGYTNYTGAAPVSGGYSAAVQPGFVPPPAPPATPAAAPTAFATPGVPAAPAAPIAPAAPPAFAPPAQQQPWAVAGAGVPGVSGIAAPQYQPPLGGETEAEYDRLASEGFQAPPATPLGQNQAPSPFSWTAARAEQERAQAPAPAAPAPVIPPVHPLAAPAAPSAAQPAPAQPTPPAPPVSQPQPAQPQSSAQQPAQPQEPAPMQKPETIVAPEPVAVQLPPAPPAAAEPAAPVYAAPAPQPAAPTPAPSVQKATGITGMIDHPLPPRPSATAAHAGEAELPDEPMDLDHTVVAPRRSDPTWVLELPDGTELPLEADVVVGRKPEPIDGSATLEVPDRTRTLSKSHARLTRVGASWIIEDLGSTNGLVLMNEDGTESELSPGVRVEATERMLFGTLEVRLRPGGDAA